MRYVVNTMQLILLFWDPQVYSPNEQLVRQQCSEERHVEWGPIFEWKAIIEAAKWRPWHIEALNWSYPEWVAGVITGHRERRRYCIMPNDEVSMDL